MTKLNLLDLLSSPSHAPARQQLGAQFGLDEGGTQSALKALLPALAAGLRHNTKQPGGLEALLGALKAGRHDQYLDEPQRLGQTETLIDGNGILGHILGSRDLSRSVASHAAQKTGLTDGLLKQMLPIVAAMVMGSLSKQSKEPDMAAALMGMLGGSQQPQRAGGLGALLGGLLGGGRQRQQAQRAAPTGGLVDMDGDGSSVDDIFKLVMQSRH